MAEQQKGRAEDIRLPKQKKKHHYAQKIVVLLVILLLLSGASVFVYMGTGNASGQQGDPLLAIKTVRVEGNTHYRDEDLIAASGLRIGQSTLSADKERAEQKILADFPYVTAVKVTSGSVQEMVITVTEISAIGAMYADGKWLVVGEDGRALEQLEVSSERPARYLYFKGARPNGEGLGKQAMEERDFTIVKKVREALKDQPLADVGEIDLTDRSDIRLSWKSQIILRIGNDSNIAYCVAVAQETLPKVLEKYGETARGVLDIRSYSDANATFKGAVFTPESEE